MRDEGSGAFRPRSLATLTLGEEKLTAVFVDSPASRNAAAMLPLTVTFHETEKAADLPSRPSTAGSPPAAAARAGDLAYYAPGATWQSSTATSSARPGLVILDALDNGVDIFQAQQGPFVATAMTAPGGMPACTSARAPVLGLSIHAR